MAKLYAELTSDKGGRVASKGGDTMLKVTLSQKNNVDYFIEYDSDGITLYDEHTGKVLYESQNI
jgi:hypothetical protein